MKKCLLILLALSLKTCYTAEAEQAPLTAEEMALLLGVSEQPSEEPTLSQLETKLKKIANMDLRNTLRFVHPDRNQDNLELANAVSQKINSKKNEITAINAIRTWLNYISGDTSITILPDLAFCAAKDKKEMDFLNTKQVPWISLDDVEALKRIKAEREAQAQAAAAQAAAQVYAAWQQQQQAQAAAAQAYAAWQQQQAQAAAAQAYAAWQQQQAQATAAQDQAARQEQKGEAAAAQAEAPQAATNYRATDKDVAKLKERFEEPNFLEKALEFAFNNPKINTLLYYNYWCYDCRAVLRSSQHTCKGRSVAPLKELNTFADLKRLQQSHNHTPCPDPTCSNCYIKSNGGKDKLIKHIIDNHKVNNSLIRDLLQITPRPAAEDDDGEPSPKRRC